MISWYLASRYALGFIALAGVVAIAAALAEGRLDRAAVLAVVVAVGIPLAIWVKRLRKSLEQDRPAGKPR